MHAKPAIALSTVVVNEAERPRVVVLVDNDREAAFKFLAERPGTVRFIERYGEVDLSEWDVLIVDSQVVNASTTGAKVDWWHRRVPLGLHIIFIQDPEDVRNSSSVLDVVTSGLEDDTILMRIDERRAIAGTRALRVDGLPDDLQSLVQRVLAPLVTSRDFQFGHAPTVVEAGDDAWDANYRPFLVGPQDVVLAGSYSRAKGNDVWMLPWDLPDFAPWFDLAMQEWHDADPARFPGTPRWIDSADWMTSRERQLTAERASESARFDPLLAEHEARLRDIDREAAAAHADAIAGRLRLLTAQGDELQAAVRDALGALGFEVEDMDLIWDERERREDFRVRDADHSDWVAIADATGVAKGVKGTKLQVLSGYVVKYMVEEKPELLPNQWLIANHLMGRDPNIRGELLRGDELKAFEAAGGLAIDSAALFELVRAVDEDLSIAGAVRDYMRTAKGQLRLADARGWLQQ